MNIWENNPNDPPWSENWQPSPEILAWFRLLLASGKLYWQTESSGHKYQIDHGTKSFILIRGNPHDSRHWHDKNIKTLAALGWKVLDGTAKGTAKGKDFDPDFVRLKKFAQSIAKVKREGVVFVSGVSYMVYPDRKQMICGKPAPEHQKLKEFMADYGWSVFSHELDDRYPDQMSFAEALTSSLLEDAGSPFDRRKVKLQYRPFALNGEWQWFWVLLPEDGKAALDTGQEVSRAQAATNARLAARKLKVVIDQIEVLKPHTKN